MQTLNGLKVLTLLISIAAIAGTSPALAKTTERESVERTIKQYETYLNASDAQSIMTLYSRKPVFMPQHSIAQVGRAAVEKAYESVFRTIDLNIKFTIYEIEIHGNSAWARTSSAGETIILADKVKISEGNNELFIFKKEKGIWKIYRYLFSTTMPRK